MSNRIAQLRAEQDPPLSQEGLARATGLSLKTIRRMEQTSAAHSRSLRLVATALGVPMDDLFPAEVAS